MYSGGAGHDGAEDGVSAGKLGMKGFQIVTGKRFI
jgi:hypothetical protein